MLFASVKVIKTKAEKLPSAGGPWRPNNRMWGGSLEQHMGSSGMSEAGSTL